MYAERARIEHGGVSIKKLQLEKALTLFPTTTIVIGSVVGSGIFVSSAGMARELGNGSVLLLVWLLAGTITLFGGLSLSYLARQFPVTGGMYEYFTALYGKRIGFLFGWANFMIAGTGSIAAIAFIFASYVGEFVDLPRLPQAWEEIPLNLGIGTLYPFANFGTKLVGATPITVCTLANIRGVRLGATLQSISTSTKLLAMLSIVAVAFLMGKEPIVAPSLAIVKGGNTIGLGWSWIAAITMALSGAFWSYDGWSNVTCIAGEVRDPQKTVPRAILLGSLTFIGFYLLINAAYLRLLPIDAIGSAPQDRVASFAISTVLGRGGAVFIALLILLSTWDTINATILTNGRVYFAMATNGAWWRDAGKIHPRFHTPYVSLVQQAAWALVLLFTGSFDLVASMYVFANWLLYVLLAFGVWICHRKFPKKEAASPVYLVVAAVFFFVASLYVGLTLISDIQGFLSGRDPVIRSILGLILVLVGLPVYALLQRRGAGRGKG